MKLLKSVFVMMSFAIYANSFAYQGLNPYQDITYGNDYFVTSGDPVQYATISNLTEWKSSSGEDGQEPALSNIKFSQTENKFYGGGFGGLWISQDSTPVKFKFYGIDPTQNIWDVIDLNHRYIAVRTHPHSGWLDGC